MLVVYVVVHMFAGVHVSLILDLSLYDNMSPLTQLYTTHLSAAIHCQQQCSGFPMGSKSLLKHTFNSEN